MCHIERENRGINSKVGHPKPTVWGEVNKDQCIPWVEKLTQAIAEINVKNVRKRLLGV